MDDEEEGDNAEEENEDYYDLLATLSKKWLNVQLTHQVSAAATNSFWAIANTFLPVISAAKDKCNVNKNVPGFVHIRRTMKKQMCPEVQMKFVYLNKNTRAIEVVHSKTSPDHKYNQSCYEKLYEEAHISVKDVIQTHKLYCPTHAKLETHPPIQFSLDGVQESKSSSTSLDVYSIKFLNCRKVIPVKIVRPTNRYKYDTQEEIKNMISDINENGLSIDTAIFDNLKRSDVKCTKCHSSTFPCEYCESPAVSYIDKKMTKRKLTWPPTTMNGRPRTITGIKRIINSIEDEDEILCKDYVKGIKGRSVFIDQPNFDFILDINVEYMHSVCIGVVKKVVELTYKVGKTNNKALKKKQIETKHFNNLMRSVKMIREFPRRCRNLDTALYKAQEYRNLVLVFFPIVIENIPQNYKKGRQLWYTLVFMIRSCVLPNEEFQIVNQQTIGNACELFYNLYFELFKQPNCTYSIHVVASHLFKIRGNVPLTERSAFPFESFYSEMKNLFKPGTKSPLKQILQNAIMKRISEYHTCQKSILYSTDKNTSMERNSLIYTFINNKYELYVINEINGDQFTCNRHGKFEFKTPLLPNYDWRTIGVFRKGPIGPQSIVIPKTEVKGKCITVLNMIITLPNNVLLEN